MEELLIIPSIKCSNCRSFKQNDSDLKCFNWKLGTNKEFFRPPSSNYSCIDDYKMKYLHANTNEQEKIKNRLADLYIDLIVEKIYCFIHPDKESVLALTANGQLIRKEKINITSENSLMEAKEKIGFLPKDRFYEEIFNKSYQLIWVGSPDTILVIKNFLN